MTMEHVGRPPDSHPIAKATAPKHAWLWHHYFLVTIVTIHVLMLGFAAWRHSPTWDEVMHVPAGLSYLYQGRFDVYNVNPPLPRMVAAIPVILVGGNFDYFKLSHSLGQRPEFHYGWEFVRANGPRSFWLMTIARWGCIPFSILGAMVCYVWANDLYGRASGMLACLLWCFSPNILAHAQLVTTDVPAAACGALAAYYFWNWLRQLNLGWAIVAGIVLGVALLTKTTWVVLVILFPAMWCATVLVARNRATREIVGQAGQLVVTGCVAIFCVNVGYGFEGSCRSLADYDFHSRFLSEGARLGRQVALEHLPIPLPENLVRGIDTQRKDFENAAPAYLGGQWKHGGWWHYYLYAALIKVPLGTWILAIAALWVAFRNRGRLSWTGEVCLLGPLVAVLVLASSQTGLNIGFRYVLPTLPFAFIWISKSARSIELGKEVSLSGAILGRTLVRSRALVVASAVTWMLSSSLWCYPSSLAYFNELARGPRNGHRYLLDSNLDWGQDLLYLRRWLERNPDVSLSGCAYVLDGFIPPSLIGTTDQLPPSQPFTKSELQPGWYAISATRLYQPADSYRYFLEFRPYALAGYSIYRSFKMLTSNTIRRTFRVYWNQCCPVA